MNKMDFSELDVEFIRDQPLWGSFLDALQDFYEGQVRDPLRQLQQIRDIKATTDIAFVKQALSDMGITVPPDMIVNPERLYNSVYMIPLLHEVLGRESAYEAIAYVLGRRVKVYDAYTEDYVNFYETPYGPLRIDGGTWYKTTHITLEMQMVGADTTMLLPTGTTLKDKFLNAFYTMAPINIVVDKFYFLIEVENKEDFGIQGVVYRHPMRRLVVDTTYGVTDGDFTLEGPDEVISGETHQYSIYAKHQIFETAEWSSSHPGYVVSDNGAVTFSGFTQDSLVTLTAVVRGVTVTKNVTVLLGMQDVRMIAIEGPATVLSNQTADYRVVAYHANGFDEVRVDIRVSSPYAYFNGNTLQVREVPADTQAGLHCKIVINNVEYTAAKLVTLKFVDPNVFMTGLTISGESRLKEDSTYPLVATASFSDNTTAEVLALWDSSSPAVSVTHGNAVTSFVNGDTDALITAKYSYKTVTMTAQFPVVVYPAFLTVESLQIIGVQEMYEETKAQFTCIAKMSDGSATMVTPKWFTSQFGISEGGVLDAGIVRDVLDVTITADYGGVQQTHIVTVAREAVSLQSLIIEGQNSVLEGNVATYVSYAQYSDGNIEKISPTWGLETEYDWATVTDGELLVEQPQESTISLKADYTVSGITYSKTKTVVCVGAVNRITGLFITGPNEVDALSRIVLTATAVYEDGSFVTVHPQWDVYTLDSNAEFIAADVSGYGVITGRNVDFDMEVIVTARYFQETFEYPITVKYVAPMGPDVPVSSRIIGNATMYSTQVGSFAQAILFKQCPSELLVSSDWTILDNPDIVVDENGFVTAKKNIDTSFTLQAVWTCVGYTVTDTMVVTVIPMDADYSGLGIIGDSTIAIGESKRYSAEVYEGEPIEGSGNIVTVDWSVISDSMNIQTFPDGTIRLSGPVVSQTITLAATYTYSGNVIEGTKTIAVEGSGPLYFNGDSDITYDQMLDAGLMLINQQFQYNFTEYGYVLYPSVFGLATIFDENDIIGDWEGAGGEETPLVHKRTVNGVEVSWYVYRTKQKNLGQKTYKIVFT